MSIVIPGKLLSSDRSAWDFGALVLSDHTIESRIPLQDAPKDDDTIILDSEECYLFPGYVSLMESLSEGCPLSQTQSNTSSTSALGALRAFLSMRREKKVQQLYADNVQIGQLQFVQFDNRRAVLKQGNNLYYPQEGAQPQPATGEIQQGLLERSNTNVVSEMVELINNYRMYEAGSKAVTTQDAMLDKSVNDVGRLT